MVEAWLAFFTLNIMLLSCFISPYGLCTENIHLPALNLHDLIKVMKPVGAKN
jgi:hypothetical protein